MSDTPNLPGFEEYPTMKSGVVPDFQQLLLQKLGKATPTAAPNGFDPHALMIKKNQEDKGEIPVTVVPPPQWSDESVKALEDFCKEHGIVGFNCGRMNPAAALFMLKQKMGYAGVPLEDRVPEGYQKKGTPNPYGPSYPYSKAVDQRLILNG